MWFVLLLTTNTFIDFLTTDQLCIDEAGPLTMLQMKYMCLHDRVIVTQLVNTESPPLLPI